MPACAAPWGAEVAAGTGPAGAARAGTCGHGGDETPPALPRPREETSIKKEKKERERQRDGHGRGRGRPAVIQSHSIFEQGPAEMMKKKGKGAAPLHLGGFGGSCPAQGSPRRWFRVPSRLLGQGRGYVGLWSFAHHQHQEGEEGDG